MVEMNGNGVDPYLFFSTAAGPTMADMYGPPSSVLDNYADGTPVARSETAISNAIGGGGGRWFQRADVHALGMLLIGAVMVHLHMEN